MSTKPVLIVGAGPTGLVLALFLTRQGVKVRVIDAAAEPGTTSRAVAVAARTLELYRQVELADEVVARGLKVAAVNLWVGGRRAAHLPFGEIGVGLSPYPFMLIFPQDQHERLLIERLAAWGVTVERGVTLTGLEAHPDRVVAQLTHPDGRGERCEAEYLAGCDLRPFVLRGGCRGQRPRRRSPASRGSRQRRLRGDLSARLRGTRPADWQRASGGGGARRDARLARRERARA
jgi:2-polyprenyl-6-methoxyphenol hydroxylase-like FAD-dependent oxidoreductase